MTLYGLFTPLSMVIAVEVLTVVVFGWPAGTATKLLLAMLSDGFDSLSA